MKHNNRYKEIPLEKIFQKGIKETNQPIKQEFKTKEKLGYEDKIDFENLKNLEEYKKYFNQTRSNTKNLTKSFNDVLKKVTEFFPKNLTKQDADQVILILRNLDIDQVTRWFVNLNINNTSEYWYYYYILSNVALRGKKVGENKAYHWKKNFSLDILMQENVDDKYYMNLLLIQDPIFNKTLEKCKKNSLSEIWGNTKDSILSISQSNPNLKMSFEMDFGYIKDTPLLSFNDFTFKNTYINNVLKLDSYNIIKKFLPKGIVHHIHLTACIDNFREIRQKLFSSNETIYKEFFFINVYEEDKIKSGSFLSMSYPRFIFIEDIITVIYSLNENTEKLFTDNFLLPDGRCVGNTEKTKNVPLNINIKNLYYFKYCKSKILFSSRLKDIKKEFVNKGLFTEGSLNKIAMDIKMINSILDKTSKINDGENLMQQDSYVPESFKEFLSSQKDILSNGIWFKFEAIFSLYENIFDNPLMLREILGYLANTFSEQKIYGVEFRQKFDVSKGESSKAKAIREEFKLKNILTSFILPGRKTVIGNGLEATLNQINQLNETDVSGVDFVGYEDDPFTGARNFFPIVAQKIFENNNDNKSNNSSDLTKKPNKDLFELFFNSLKRGNKLYLHAGETLYFPNYSIDEEFMKEFYINDNLIHAALLPNVERLGHGFALINNDLLISIFKAKNIGLEICPVSNKLLYYHDINLNPFLKLLRKGIKVSISPDDPGFFGYTGVAMDWFQILMQTDIKLSEIYLLLKNSILKASPNIYIHKDILIERLQKDFTEFIHNFKCKDLDTSNLQLSPSEIDHRDSFKQNRDSRINNWIRNILKKDSGQNPLINVYDKDMFINRIKKDLNLI